MIGQRNIRLQADKPCMKILPITTFVGSPSTIHVVGIPPTIGKWAITSVYAEVQNAVGASPIVYQATKTIVEGGFDVWTFTVPAVDVSCTIEGGVVICADGIDEQGNERTHYILGQTDYVVQNLDRTISN